jgi:hypothetical protein
MDDMGTPGPTHPAWRGLGKRTEGQFDNVIDLAATRSIKNITGQVKPIKIDRTPVSATEEKHMSSIIKDDMAAKKKTEFKNRLQAIIDRTSKGKDE